ncbi:MAG: GNAT family N-acetyltransferase [Alphaproteobacteria bacterium]|nr:GNAT family N-acetyltransferase [Alphaproteobacteria bacterium]
MTIRNARRGDLPALIEIADSTGMFLGGELQSFVDVLTAHLDGADGAAGARLIVSCNADDTPVGATYSMSETMSQRVANLLFIGVLPASRRGGHGAMLLDDFEADARAADMRLAIIETASDAMFAAAWSLYRRHGYAEVARVADFYDDGLDKLIFRKRISGADGASGR